MHTRTSCAFLLSLMALGPFYWGLVWAGTPSEMDGLQPYLVDGEDLENDEGPRYAIQVSPRGLNAQALVACDSTTAPRTAVASAPDPGQVRRAQIREVFFLHHAPANLPEPRRMSLEERDALREELNSAVRDAYGLQGASQRP